MDVHKETIAVAYVAHDHGAAGTAWGPIGSRQCAIEQMIRKRRAQAQHLLVVSAAGPCGSWR